MGAEPSRAEPSRAEPSRAESSEEPPHAASSATALATAVQIKTAREPVAPRLHRVELRRLGDGLQHCTNGCAGNLHVSGFDVDKPVTTSEITGLD
jgi:hypothetical protein